MKKQAKEKAKELVSKFTFLKIPESNSDFYNPNQCALIVVNEIIEFSEKLGEKLYKEVGTDSYESRCKNYDLREYWKEVKQEIEKL